MTQLNELDVMKKIDDLFSNIEDQITRNRILVWANSKFGDPNLKQQMQAQQSPASKPTKGRKPQVKSPTKKKAKTTLSQVKDLNTSPSGKQSLNEFAEEKKPNNHKEKGTLIAYYLRNILERDPSVNLIFTCYKHLSWRLPSDLLNMLQQAGTAGYLDTSDRENIVVTPQGHNLIEHDLPREKK
ncbi:MAG: hypothetical protein WBB69_08480 [Anaerolineales bacterium]